MFISMSKRVNSHKWRSCWNLRRGTPVRPQRRPQITHDGHLLVQLRRLRQARRAELHVIELEAAAPPSGAAMSLGVWISTSYVATAPLGTECRRRIEPEDGIIRRRSQIQHGYLNACLATLEQTDNPRRQGAIRSRRVLHQKGNSDPISTRRKSLGTQPRSRSACDSTGTSGLTTKP